MYEPQNPDTRARQKAKATLQRIGTQLINACKTAHLGHEPTYDAISRDILSVLGAYHTSWLFSTLTGFS
jgi:hypothetical protein